MSIYGIHEKCPYDVMPKGWVLYIAEVGDSNDPHPGIDLSGETRARMIRIQWLFGESGGCYPPPERLLGFVGRVKSLVRNTPDCHTWVAGNECNIATEGLFSPEYAAQNYTAIRNAVHTQRGHENDIVLLPPVGPWNVEIGYGWIEYFVKLINLCPDIDGFALHTYSRGANPASVTSEDKMDAPYDHLYNGFRTYRDWMAAIPQKYRNRPVFITETDQNDAWADVNSGWVQAAYKEIDDWNHTKGNQVINAMLLYRWPKYDKYFINGKSNVIADFKAAIAKGYKVPEGQEPVGNNLLTNGDMEHPYEYQKDQYGNPLQTVLKPHGWTAFWYNVMPEYKFVEPIYPDRIHSGTTAAQFFKNYDTPNGGFFQIVSGLKPGKTYKLTGWAQIWAIYKNGNDVPASVELRVSPYGSTDSNDSRNIYGTPHLQAHNQYVALSPIEFEAKSDSATIFLVAIFQDPGQDMNAYFDTISLVRVGGDPEPPEPPVPGECDLKDLYYAQAQTHQILSEAHQKAAEVWAKLLL